ARDAEDRPRRRPREVPDAVVPGKHAGHAQTALNAPTRSKRATRHAGTRPASTPAATDTQSATAHPPGEVENPMDRPSFERLGLQTWSVSAAETVPIS